MRKYLLFACLILVCSVSSFSQVKCPDIAYDSVKDFTRFESIIEVPGKTKLQLYTIASKWVALSYKSGKSVTDLSDKESGEIVIKGRSTLISYRVMGMDIAREISHTIAISLKDNKLRMVCEFETMYHPATSGTRIGNSYVSGASASEVSVWQTLNGKGYFSKKDKLILTHSLLKEYLGFCCSLIESINGAEKGNDW